MAKEHFKAAAAKVRGAAGNVSVENDGKVKHNVLFFANRLREGDDPREVFNFFVEQMKKVPGVDDKEIARIALNQRNMYYAKLHKMKLEPKPIKVDVADEVPEVDVDITKAFQSKQPKEQAELSSKLITGEKINSKSLGGGGELGSSSTGGHANLAYRITIKDDGRACLKGVSRGGEYGMPQNEVFCYQAATMIGFDVVPPCVYRTDEKLGQCSAQAWIENGILGAEILDNPEVGPIESSPKLKDSISQLAVFDIVFGNWDRHAGNWMYDEESGRVVGIDNGLVGLDVGRGQGTPQSWANVAWNRAGAIAGAFDENITEIIKPEHVDQARKFVESPEFIALLKTHFEQEQFQDHLKTRKTTSATYIKHMLKMTQAGLAKLDHEIKWAKKTVVSDLLRKKVKRGKICLVQ
jgi:hypothetical protein